jgi:hypothetical protein
VVALQVGEIMTNITVTTKGDSELLALLDRLPKLVVSAGGPTDRAVKAGAAVVLRRARSLVPQSKKTGSRKKQSWASYAKWQETLSQQLKVKAVRFPTASFAVVGPKSPEGNMANFVQGKPRRHVLWGKSTQVAMYRYQRNWMLQASDESRSEMLAAMKASVISDIDKNMKGQL